MRRDNYLLASSFINDPFAINASDISKRKYMTYLTHFLLWVDDRKITDALGSLNEFINYLNQTTAKKSGAHLAYETVEKIINITKRFIRWLCDTQPEYKKIDRRLYEILRPTTQGDHTSPEHVTLEEVKQLILMKVSEDDLPTKRDLAAAAFLFLPGMRASAFVTLPIKAIDLSSMTVEQFPELGVRTKNRKHATTILLQIPSLLKVVCEWDKIVRGQLDSSSPWYAVIENRWGEYTLTNAIPGANRGQKLIKNFRRLFLKANMEYHSPHKFRHGHAVYGVTRAKTLGQYKAISQNLMHADITITDKFYSGLSVSEAKKLIFDLDGKNAPIEGEKPLQQYSSEEIINEVKARLSMYGDAPPPF